MAARASASVVLLTTCAPVMMVTGAASGLARTTFERAAVTTLFVAALSLTLRGATGALAPGAIFTLGVFAGAASTTSATASAATAATGASAADSAGGTAARRERLFLTTVTTVGAVVTVASGLSCALSMK